MFNYNVDVREIVEEIGASVYADAPLSLDVLDVGEEHFTLRQPAMVNVTISNAGEGLVAYGTVSAEVTATCSRCLCEFPTVIEGEVEGFYLRPGERAHHDAEEEVGAVDMNGMVDLGPALLAALVIEAPYAPLHDEECQGLCPTCGTDLNAGPCSCDHEVDPDHPFAGLAGLLGGEEESG